MDTCLLDLYEAGKRKMNDDYFGALDIFIKIRDRAAAKCDNKLLGQVLLDMCFIYRNLSDSINGFKTSDSALKCYEALENTEGQARANNYLGIFCFYSGLFQKALKYFMTAENLMKDVDCPKLYLSILSNIGEVYKEADNYDYAMVFYEKAEALAELNKMDAYNAAVLTNIGEVHLIKNNLYKALDYFMKAFSYLDSDNEAIYTGELLSKIGIIHMKLGNIDIALHYLNQAIKKFESIDNKYYLVDTLIQLYDLKRLSKCNDAMPILEQAYKNAVLCGADKKLTEIEKRFHDYYVSIGEYKKALSHFTNYHYLTTKTESSNLIHKLEIMQLENEIVDKMPPNVMLKEIIESQYAENSRIVDLLKKQNSILKKQANYDILTNMPNRRNINQKLKLLNSPKHGKCHALMMIDIDHFKWVNDGMGHTFGDLCLEKIADILLEETGQANAYVGRYGGEEFVCIVENIDIDLIQPMAEQMCKKVKDANIAYTYEEKHIDVTISVSYTIISDFLNTTVNEYIEMADRALYKAKGSGRNCVRQG